jgi:hypothetical protein
VSLAGVVELRVAMRTTLLESNELSRGGIIGLVRDGLCRSVAAVYCPVTEESELFVMGVT